MDDFTVIDLVAQRDAVKRHLGEASKAEVLSWLGERGTVAETSIQDREVFWFESYLGIRSPFFFSDDGEMIFVGDHHTFK